MRQKPKTNIRKTVKEVYQGVMGFFLSLFEITSEEVCPEKSISNHSQVGSL